MTTQLRLAILALVLIATPGAGGLHAAAAQDAVADCTAFASFDEANAYYAAHPDAESAIDDDADGTACEVYFGQERRDPTAGTPAAESDNAAGSDDMVAFAQNADADLDCEDFDTQEEAQAVLDQDPSDPNNLDPNGDQIACGLLPSAADFQSANTGGGQDQAANDGDQTQEERRQNRNRNRQNRQNDQQNETQTCDDFATQEEAQAAFDADPEGLTDLDPDGNGVACEELLPATPAAENDREARRAARQNQRNQNENNQNQNTEETPTTVVIEEPTPAAVPEDIDCADFATQEEAQAVYDRDPSDPFNLDPSGDGIACSSLPSSTTVVSQVPRTGTGIDDAAARNALAAAGLLLLGLSGAWALRRAQH